MCERERKGEDIVNTGVDTGLDSRTEALTHWHNVLAPDTGRKRMMGNSIM